MVGGFTQNSFLKINSLFDSSGIDSLIGSTKKATKNINSMTQALNQAAKVQRAFQKQTQPGLQKGRSVFGRRPGRGLQPANDALKEAQQMSLGANEGMRRYSSTLNDAGERVMQFQGSQKQMARMQKRSNAAGKQGNRTFGKLFGVGMNLMFMGMALQKMFGGLAKSMLKTVGTSQTFGAAAKSVLLPFFIKIAPLLNKVAFFFMNLSKPIKMVLGAFVALMAVMATFLFFGAQVGIMAATISGSFAALSASMLVIVAGLALISVGFAGLVMLFQEGKRAMGAAMVAASALGLALLALASKSAIAAGFLGPLAGAVATLKASTLAAAGAVNILNLSLSSVLLIISSLVLGIILLNRIIKKFGPVVGLIATMIGGVLLAALSPVAAIIFVIVGAFMAVNKILKKFEGIIKVVVGIAIAAIAALLAIFVGGPLVIAGAIGAILAVLWSFKDGIMKAFKQAIGIVSWFIDAVVQFFKDLWNGITDTVSKIFDAVLGFARDLRRKPVKTIKQFVGKAVGFFKDLWKKGKNFVTKLIDFITSIPSKIKNGLVNLGSAMVELGKTMIEGLVEGIKSLGGMIADAFFSILPGPLSTALKGVTSFAGDLVGGITDVLTPNDFILTSGGKMIQPDSKDTIVGFNGDGPIQPGGGGSQVEVNINDPVMKEDIDVERVVDEVEERVNRDTRGRSGGLGK